MSDDGADGDEGTRQQYLTRHCSGRVPLSVDDPGAGQGEHGAERGKDGTGRRGASRLGRGETLCPRMTPTMSSRPRRRAGMSAATSVEPTAQRATAARTP